VGKKTTISMQQGKARRVNQKPATKDNTDYAVLPNLAGILISCLDPGPCQ